MLSELLFRFLWVALVLPGRSWRAGAHGRDLVGGLGQDLEEKGRKKDELRRRERRVLPFWLRSSFSFGADGRKWSHGVHLYFKSIVGQVAATSESGHTNQTRPSFKFEKEKHF